MERNGNEQNKQTNIIYEKHIIENLKKNMILMLL